MSPKRSKEHQGLPARVTHKHGAYYYLKPTIKPGGKAGTKWIRLGRTEREMHQAMAEIKTEGRGLMGAVIQRYRDDVLTKKARSTQNSQGKQLDRLNRAFGHMRPSDIRPAHNETNPTPNNWYKSAPCGRALRIMRNTGGWSPGRTYEGQIEGWEPNTSHELIAVTYRGLMVGRFKNSYYQDTHVIAKTFNV